MGEPATEKQIKFASSLGIENPEQYDKQTLRGVIDAKTGGSKKDKPLNSYQKPSNGQIQATETIVREIKMKANSFEFGKAGCRMKLYFEDLEDLQKQIDEAVQAGLVDDPKIRPIE